MAGCKKADRNRKSKQGLAYKSGQRWSVNKARRIAKDEAFKAAKAEQKESKNFVKRGTARWMRRHNSKVGLNGPSSPMEKTL